MSDQKNEAAKGGSSPALCSPDFDDDHRLCCDLEHGDERWRMLRDYTGKPVHRPEYWHHMTNHLRRCGWVLKREYRDKDLGHE